MSTLYALVRQNSVFFCEELLEKYTLASIQDVPVIHDAEIVTTEGRHIAHDGRWVTIHTVESLVNEVKPVPKIGSVSKATVISRIQEHLNHQADDISEVTLFNTSSNCEVIGGRIAKQVVSTLEARNYLDKSLLEIGWGVAKAGKDYIALERKPTVEKLEEAAEVTVERYFEQENQQVPDIREMENKRNFLGFKIS